MTALLSGVTVLDLSSLLPGPLATWHLASLGASVVKVESPSRGDYAREIGPTDGDRSLFYGLLNEGKDILPLELTDAGDRAAFLGRVSRSDLVVESFRPGVLERLELGFDRIREANPRACLVSITGYGREGDMARRAGHDINFLAQSGWLNELIGGQNEPTVPNVQIADILGGALTAAFAAVSAVLRASRTGIGCHVVISMTGALASCNLLPLAYARAGKSPPPSGGDLLNGGVPCYGLYRTRDGRYLAVGALESKFWDALCDAIGRPDLEKRHWQRGQEIGGDDARAVRGELGRIFAQKSLTHWETLLAGVDCCVTPVLRMDEVLERGGGRCGIHTVTAHDTPSASMP